MCVFMVLLKRFDWNISYDLRDVDSYGRKMLRPGCSRLWKNAQKKIVLTAFRSSVGLPEFVSFAYLFWFFLLCIYSHRQLSL